MTDRYAPTPSLPDPDLDDEEDLAMIRTIERYAEENDLDGLTAEKMIMTYFGVDPEDIVFIPDDDSATGYRAVTKEDYLGAKEGLANLKEHLSKKLRHEYGVPPGEVEELDTLTDFVDAYNDARAAQEGGDQG